MPSNIRRFSHSLIATYLDCPRKAYYRYVEGRRSPANPALVRGSACDAAWNDNLLQKMDTGEDLSWPVMEELTRRAVTEKVDQEGGPGEVDWQDSDAETVEESAVRLSRQWLLHLAPLIEPTDVQVRYERTLADGREFIGFVDLEGVVEGRSAVADNKTGSSKMAAGKAERDLQPYAYAWLRQEPVEFVFLRAIETRGGNASAETVWTSRGEEDLDVYGLLVDQVDRGFGSGTFPTNPASTLCGPRWCSYWDICEVGRGVTGRQNGASLPAAITGEAKGRKATITRKPKEA